MPQRVEPLLRLARHVDAFSISLKGMSEAYYRDVLGASLQPVLDAVLALRGFGTTDVAGALTAAADQLSRSRAGRRITVLLSDCRATTPGDVTRARSARLARAASMPAGSS